MKLGMHVSVVESGRRGVLVGLEGETATVRLRAEDKSLSAETLTIATSGLKGEKGRPVNLDRIAAEDAAASEPAAEPTGAETTSAE